MPKRIRRDPEKHAAQKRAWKIAHRERVNELARATRADPEKRAHERELERIRRAKNRDEFNANRRGTRTDYKNLKERMAADPQLLEEVRTEKREQMRRLRSNPEYLARQNELERAWYEANPDRGPAYAKKWRDNPDNKGKVRASWVKRRLVIEQQTPAWADLKAIAIIYGACPPSYHVDHIIPLRGKNVSGLHIETNLQYLPSAENLKKRNKF